MTLFQSAKFACKPIAIAALLLSIAAIAPLKLIPAAKAEGNPLSSDGKNPLSLTLADLDGSWRQFKIAGQYEFADVVGTWASFFGKNNYSNSYYTQGKIVTMAGQNYLVAYRVPISIAAVDMEGLFGSFYSMQSCDPSSLNPALSLETKVSLALLNVTTIGSLNDIQSLDIPSELAKSQDLYSKALADCYETEAKQGLSSIAQGEQMMYANSGILTDRIADLPYGAIEDSPQYSYRIIKQSDILMYTQAIAKLPDAFHFVGAIAGFEDMGYLTTTSIMCKSKTPQASGTFPEPPIFNATSNTLKCAEGSEEVLPAPMGAW